MEYDYIKLLKKLSLDLKKYSQAEIEDALIGKSKFGIIDKVVEKIKKKINSLNLADQRKLLNGEIDLVVLKKTKASKKPSKPDYTEIIEYLKVVKTREEAKNYIQKARLTIPYLKELLNNFEIEFKSSDKKKDLIFKLVNETVGSRLKRSVFIKDS